jgi:hypothetical protein
MEKQLRARAGVPRLRRWHRDKKLAALSAVDVCGNADPMTRTPQRPSLEPSQHGILIDGRPQFEAAAFVSWRARPGAC